MPPDAQPSAAPAIIVRPATPDDAAALAVLAQELLAFYGLTSPYQLLYGPRHRQWRIRRNLWN